MNPEVAETSGEVEADCCLPFWNDFTPVSEAILYKEIGKGKTFGWSWCVFNSRAYHTGILIYIDDEPRFSVNWGPNVIEHRSSISTRLKGEVTIRIESSGNENATYKNILRSIDLTSAIGMEEAENALQKLLSFEEEFYHPDVCNCKIHVLRVLESLGHGVEELEEIKKIVEKEGLAFPEKTCYRSPIVNMNHVMEADRCRPVWNHLTPVSEAFLYKEIENRKSLGWSWCVVNSREHHTAIVIYIDEEPRFSVNWGPKVIELSSVSTRLRGEVTIRFESSDNENVTHKNILRSIDLTSAIGMEEAENALKKLLSFEEEFYHPDVCNCKIHLLRVLESLGHGVDVLDEIKKTIKASGVVEADGCLPFWNTFTPISEAFLYNEIENSDSLGWSWCVVNSWVYHTAIVIYLDDEPRFSVNWGPKVIEHLSGILTPLKGGVTIISESSDNKNVTYNKSLRTIDMTSAIGREEAENALEKLLSFKEEFYRPTECNCRTHVLRVLESLGHGKGELKELERTFEEEVVTFVERIANNVVETFW